MLVVTANWAFSDGTLSSAQPDRPGLWLPAVHRAVLRAGFRRDGVYRPVPAVDVVLAGDTFDWLTSRVWTDDLRPWHGGSRTRAAREGLMLSTVWRARRLLAALAAWGRRGLPVPTADRRGRPRPETSVRIPLSVTLLAGDRDRWLDAVALAAARHGCGVGRAWSDDRVVVRHGEELDPLCDDSEGRVEWSPRGPERERQPTLGESLAVDLVARFAAAIVDWSSVRPATRRLATMLARISPREIPAAFACWWAAADGGGPLSEAARGRVITAWRHAVAAWLRETHRLPPRCDVVGSPFAAWADWLDRSAHPDGHDRHGSDDSDLTRLFAPTTGAAIRAALQPGRPTAGRPPTHVVGHLPARADCGGRGAVCLGAPALGTYRRPSAAPERAGDPDERPAAPVRLPRPVTVTGIRTSTGMVWEWLEGEPGGDGAMANCASDGGRERLRIVDAA